MWTREHRETSYERERRVPRDLSDAARDQQKLLIPFAKPGGLPRKTEMRGALTAISFNDVAGAYNHLNANGVKINGKAKYEADSEFETPVVISDITSKSLSVGAYTYIGQGCDAGHLEIGRFCSVAKRVVLGPAEHPLDMMTTHPFGYGKGGAFMGDPYYACLCQKNKIPVKNKLLVGNDVWIGDGAFVKDGVTIGDGAVIAARAVVSKSVPPYAIVAGIPARVLRYRFSEAVIHRLLTTRWWEWDLRGLRLDYKKVEKSLDTLESAIARGAEKLVFRKIYARRNEAGFVFE